MMVVKEDEREKNNDQGEEKKENDDKKDTNHDGDNDSHNSSTSSKSTNKSTSVATTKDAAPKNPLLLHLPFFFQTTNQSFAYINKPHPGVYIYIKHLQHVLDLVQNF
mmetsp:Transcript_23498/g.31129  ORF Transcript_23498/g.31129 Transcript_23498/m.31129 type:complete len:107 (+) Transcript_23498:336-656(+)